MKDKTYLIHPPAFIVHPLEGPLRGERGSERVGCSGKCIAERIADDLKDVTAMRFNCIAQDFVVARESSVHRVRVLLPQPRTALDVGEEEGDRPSRQR
jgi:hypothetical protein